MIDEIIHLAICEIFEVLVFMALAVRQNSMAIDGVDGALSVFKLVDAVPDLLVDLPADRVEEP